jgi:hypothetical protein
MKNIEDYWFACVTDERLEKESLADLLRVLEQHLPYLLDGIINSQDEHVGVTSKSDYSEKVGFFANFLALYFIASIPKSLLFICM